MPKNKLKLINGGRDDIEHGMVEALVSGDFGKLDKLRLQLQKIDHKPKPKLPLVSQLNNTSSSKNSI